MCNYTLVMKVTRLYEVWLYCEKLCRLFARQFE